MDIPNPFEPLLRQSWPPAASPRDQQEPGEPTQPTEPGEPTRPDQPPPAPVA
ncbi:hypothetical protein ACFOJE_18925 [Azotobacter bryophylli]|uniref:Uncharacterized protein n=1 Tax=Azotobacter bryophylli TaxID=1986537 RepID=A0ABV7AXF6_9GAMM